MLPESLSASFEVVDVEVRESAGHERLGIESGEIVFHLDEINVYHGAEDGHVYRPNGFCEPSRVRDFPLRDKRVTLQVRRRRWLDETTGESIGNKYEVAARGTRQTVEFADFLKEAIGHIPGIRILS